MGAVIRILFTLVRTQTPGNQNNSKLPISNRVLASAGYSVITGSANDIDRSKNE